jgi:hypothetical protein
MSEDGAGFRTVFHSRIRVGSASQQDFDVVEVIHVRLSRRIVAAFDVPVVRRQV